MIPYDTTHMSSFKLVVSLFAKLTEFDLEFNGQVSTNSEANGLAGKLQKAKQYCQTYQIQPTKLGLFFSCLSCGFIPISRPTFSYSDSRQRRCSIRELCGEIVRPDFLAVSRHVYLSKKRTSEIQSLNAQEKFEQTLKVCLIRRRSFIDLLSAFHRFSPDSLRILALPRATLSLLLFTI